MYFIFTILFFIFGLVVGSFLNVVIYRLHAKQSFAKGRSKCPKCKHVLGIIDLIPLFSFLIQKGQCRYCHKKISWQYFLVELFTGILFVLVYLQFDLYLLFFYLVICSFLIIIFIYDLKHYLILDKITIPAIIIAIVGNLLLGMLWWDILIGMAIGGGLFMFQFIISKGKWIGGGDIRLGALMGALLGWQLVLVALFIAYLVGSVVGVALIIGKRKKLKDPMPFGVFLSMATILCLLYGKIILDLYLNLFYII